MTTEHDDTFNLEMTTDIVSAYVGNNPIAVDQLPGLIAAVSSSLEGLGAPEAEPVPERGNPAVSIKKSVQDDHLVCLEDGKKFKSLKRHIRTSHGLTPQEYRQRWGLKPDYPMTAPAYAETRSKLAKSIGLGRKAGKRKSKPKSKPKAKS